MKCLRPSGRLALVAIYSKPPTFDAVYLTRQEITMTGSRAYRHMYPEVIEALASGLLNCDGLVTAIVPVSSIDSKYILANIFLQLNDIKEKGFEALLKEPEKHIKILVKP